MLTNFGFIRSHGVGGGDLGVEVKKVKKVYFSLFCIYNYNTRLKISFCIIWDLGVGGVVVGGQNGKKKSKINFSFYN